MLYKQLLSLVPKHFHCPEVKRSSRNSGAFLLAFIYLLFFYFNIVNCPLVLSLSKQTYFISTGLHTVASPTVPGVIGRF